MLKLRFIWIAIVYNDDAIKTTSFCNITAAAALRRL